MSESDIVERGNRHSPIVTPLPFRDEHVAESAQQHDRAMALDAIDRDAADYCGSRALAPHDAWAGLRCAVGSREVVPDAGP